MNMLPATRAEPGVPTGLCHRSAAVSVACRNGVLLSDDASKVV